MTRVAVGDRVTSTYYLRWIDGPQRLAHVREQFGANHDGWLASYAVLGEESVVRIPEHLTDAEAASLTCAGVVAWAALTKPVPVGPGETVLTVGTGTVALFAVQFAKMHGARVISVTSSPEKAKRLRELGADEVIDRTGRPTGRRRCWNSPGRRCRTRGGAVGMLTLPKSVAAGAFNALITLIGAFPGRGTDRGSVRRQVPVHPPHRGGLPSDFETMNRAIAVHRIRPVIDRVFGFSATGRRLRWWLMYLAYLLTRRLSSLICSLVFGVLLGVGGDVVRAGDQVIIGDQHLVVHKSCGPFGVYVEHDFLVTRCFLTVLQSDRNLSVAGMLGPFAFDRSHLAAVVDAGHRYAVPEHSHQPGQHGVSR